MAIVLRAREARLEELNVIQSCFDYELRLDLFANEEKRMEQYALNQTKMKMSDNAKNLHINKLDGVAQPRYSRLVFENNEIKFICITN